MGMSGRMDHLQIARILGIPIYLHFSWLIIFGLIVWTLSTGYFPAQYPDPAGLVPTGPTGSWRRSSSSYRSCSTSWGTRSSPVATGCARGRSHCSSSEAWRSSRRIPGTGAAEFRMAAAGPVVSLALAGVFYALRGPAVRWARVRRGGREVPGPDQPDARRSSTWFPPSRWTEDGCFAAPCGGRWARRAPRGSPAEPGSSLRFLPDLRGRLQPGEPASTLGGLWYVLIGWFIKDASAASYRQVRLDEALRGLSVRDAMVEPVATDALQRLRVRGRQRSTSCAPATGAYPVTRG